MDDSRSREKFSLVHRRSREQTKFHMERFLASFCTKKKNRWRLARSSSSFVICHLHLVGRQSEKRNKLFFCFFQGMVEMLVG